MAFGRQSQEDQEFDVNLGYMSHFLKKQPDGLWREGAV